MKSFKQEIENWAGSQSKTIPLCEAVTLQVFLFGTSRWQPHSSSASKLLLFPECHRDEEAGPHLPTPARSSDLRLKEADEKTKWQNVVQINRTRLGLTVWTGLKWTQLKLSGLIRIQRDFTGSTWRVRIKAFNTHLKQEVREPEETWWVAADTLKTRLRSGRWFFRSQASWTY